MKTLQQGAPNVQIFHSKMKIYRTSHAKNKLNKKSV